MGTKLIHHSLMWMVQQLLGSESPLSEGSARVMWNTFSLFFFAHLSNLKASLLKYYVHYPLVDLSPYVVIIEGGYGRVDPNWVQFLEKFSAFQVHSQGHSDVKIPWLGHVNKRAFSPFFPKSSWVSVTWIGTKGRGFTICPILISGLKWFLQNNLKATIYCTSFALQFFLCVVWLIGFWGRIWIRASGQGRERMLAFNELDHWSVKNSYTTFQGPDWF